jgi:hypothetical protein
MTCTCGQEMRLVYVCECGRRKEVEAAPCKYLQDRVICGNIKNHFARCSQELCPMEKSK